MLVSLVESKLNSPSQVLLEKLRDRFPQLEEYYQMSNQLDNGVISGGFNLHLKIPSPTKVEKRDIQIWFATNDEDVSLEFGNWHSHGWEMHLPMHSPYYQMIDLLDFIELIFQNRICLFEYSDEPNFTDLIDINNQELILEVVSDPECNGKINIFSWDGSKDHKISINDFMI